MIRCCAKPQRSCCLEPSSPNLSEKALEQWESLGPSYRSLIAGGSESSAYLRDIGLKPEVLRLLGDCLSDSVLDVGAGGGWLFDLVKAREAHACDLVRPERLAEHVDFKIADASSLPWQDGVFDAVVSNLMLCYVPEFVGPLREMGRVCKVGGRLVIGLVHPYFYRTFEVDGAKGLVLTADLSHPFSLEITIGNLVGPFAYYYRPYPDYLNAIIRAGFAVREVGDWFIDGDRYRAAFPRGDTVSRSDKVPLFTFFSCVRIRSEE